MDSKSLQSGQTANGNFVAQASEHSVSIVNVFQAAQASVVAVADAVSAEVLLQQIPLDNMTELGGLPPHSTLPWSRNRFFVGREDELRLLAGALRDGGAAAVGVSPVITGIGGQGKTQLAVEFAYRYGAWFTGGVSWVSFADASVIPEGIAACGTALFPNDASFDQKPLARRVSLVVSAWSSTMVRLLIFDNCEYEALFDEWAPKVGASRILITSKLRSWPKAGGFRAVPLGSFSATESKALLSHYLPERLADGKRLSRNGYGMIA